MFPDTLRSLHEVMLATATPPAVSTPRAITPDSPRFTSSTLWTRLLRSHAHAAGNCHLLQPGQCGMSGFPVPAAAGSLMGCGGPGRVQPNSRQNHPRLGLHVCLHGTFASLVRQTLLVGQSAQHLELQDSCDLDHLQHTAVWRPC